MEIFVRYEGACLTERPSHFVRPGCATKPTSTHYTLHTSVSVSHQHRTHIVLGCVILQFPVSVQDHTKLRYPNPHMAVLISLQTPNAYQHAS
jgi:hypothetical protein